MYVRGQVLWHARDFMGTTGPQNKTGVMIRGTAGDGKAWCPALGLEGVDWWWESAKRVRIRTRARLIVHCSLFSKYHFISVLNITSNKG